MENMSQWAYGFVLYAVFHQINGINYLLDTSTTNPVVGASISFYCKTEQQYVQFSYVTTFNTTAVSQCIIIGVNNDGSCKFSGSYNINYTFICNNVIGNYTLQIPGKFVTENLHRTKWTCSNPLLPSQSSTAIELRVYVPISKATVTAMPYDTNPVKIKNGTSQLFACTTDAGRPSARIQWYLSDDNITNFATGSISSCASNCIDEIVISSSNLTLTGHVTYDGKYIYCTALNIDSANSVKSQNKTIVIVYGPTQVTVSPSKETYTVNETDTVIPITCTADCKPTCAIIWKRLNVTVATSSVLHLQDIDRNQTGNYNCIASNEVGSKMSDTVTVNVNYGPRHTNISPSALLYTVNETGRVGPISCTADCKPACTITWSGPNLPSGTLSLLNLQNIDRNQAGEYQCMARNLLGNTKSVVVNIVVHYGPVQVTVSPSTETYTVNETGSIIQITCTADCQPTCTMIWRRLNVTVATSSVLHLQNIDRNQAGNYNCIASNEVGSKMSVTVTVIVNYGPRQTNIYPSALLYTINETGSVDQISCTADCKPTCTITWSGPNLPSGTLSVLTLKNIDRNQAGEYHCTARNLLGNTKSVTIDIVVYYGPSQVTVSPSTKAYTVNETGSVMPITCTADCKPTCTMIWRRRNVTVATTSELNLQNIYRNQSGTYKCIASNEVGSKISVAVAIKVNYIPEITNLSGNKTVSENDTAFILCSYESEPLPEISWMFNGVPITGQDIETHSTFSKLVLRHIKCLSMGIYTCEASNIVGKRAKIFQVEVFCAPRIYAKENNVIPTIIPITDDEPINITAHILAFPKPDIQWKFVSNYSAKYISNEFISNQFNANLHLSSLFISNVSETDFGYYNIYANNSNRVENGYIHSYNVIPARKPNPPNNVTCFGKTDSVEVYWQPGFNGGDEQNFRVELRKYGNENFLSYEILYTENMDEYITAVIQPLHPNTKYSFRVLAINRHNYSVSEIVYCNTSRSVSTAQQKNNLIALGTGTGVGIAIIVIIIVIMFVRRTKKDRRMGKTDQLLNRKDKKKSSSGSAENVVLKDNILYESAGSDFKAENPCGSAYAKVKKNNGKKISTDGGYTEGSLYAEVKKKVNNLKDTNEKKSYILPNDDLRDIEDIYENQVNTNKDGLVYADLEFIECNKGKQFITHGIDNKTDYADIDITLKADPLPSDESDKEDNNTIE